MYKQSRNVEVEMSSGFVIEPLSTGCTPITYDSGNNSEVKHECDLGQLATLRGERRQEASCSSGLSTKLKYDWTVNQNKVFIHSLLQQDKHLHTISLRHILSGQSQEWLIKQTVLPISLDTS